ncbi:hypothetical protein [Thermostilla marina]
MGKRFRFTLGVRFAECNKGVRHHEPSVVIEFLPGNSPELKATE